MQQLGVQMFRKILNKLVGNKWIVVETKFPYDEGYGTYNKFLNTLLDSGLTKLDAEELCKELNMEYNL